MPLRTQNTKDKKIRVLRRNLLAWFRKAGRTHLPWRQTSDPYAIVVSEIMLQQTQVERVIPKYEAFLKRFPNWGALAQASQAEVVKLWHGLGYNRRALGLHRLAQAVVSLGQLPQDPEAMQQLPAIGPYTAQAVSAFAFRRKKAAPVDTNIERVLKRVFGAYDLDRKQLAELAREVVPVDSWTWNHAMMDFGASVCVARSPKCEVCPLQDICAAYPCEGDDIKKVKQTTFKNSDRFYRGQLISFLRQNSVLRRNDVGKTLHLTDDQRIQKIIDSLVKDQFIIEDAGGKIRLVE